MWPAEMIVVDGGENAVLVNVCPVCKKAHESRKFPVGRWSQWLRAYCDADAGRFWPEMSAAEREEFFASGVCDACRKEMEDKLEDDE